MAEGKRWASARFALRASLDADAALSWSTFALQALTPLGPVAAAWLLKVTADAVLEGDVRKATLTAGGAAAFIALGSFATSAALAARATLLDRNALHLEQWLLRTLGSIPGVEHFERPDVADRVALLRKERSQLGFIVDVLSMAVAAVAPGFVSALLLATIHPALLVLPLCGVPSVLLGRRNQRLANEFEERTAERRRRSHHLEEVLLSSTGGREARVSGAADELVEFWRKLRATQRAERLRLDFRIAATNLVGSVLVAAGYALAVLMALALALDRRATVGDVLLTLAIAGRLTVTISDLSAITRILTWLLAIAERCRWLEEYARERTRPLQTVAPPERLTEGIRLEGVTFRYPGCRSTVLDGVDLELSAGSTVAVVGDNGAGKTTLVKLLLGLYAPTEGVIRVDGRSLADFELEQWRQRCTAAFQDFVCFSLVARQSVGIGELAHVDDDAAVLSAFGRARSEDLVAQLPEGLATQLGCEFDNGRELSGGQWQKIALARAMMRSPLLVLLDEPTASLDARIESELFSAYAVEAKAVALMHGAVTVLVSHRFSTVRAADLIVVLDGGRVVERGTHNELLALRGQYSELYGIQAKSYR